MRRLVSDGGEADLLERRDGGKVRIGVVTFFGGFEEGLMQDEGEEDAVGDFGSGDAAVGRVD